MIDRFALPLIIVVLVWLADAVGQAAVTSPDPLWQWVRLVLALVAALVGLVVIVSTRGDGRWLR